MTKRHELIGDLRGFYADKTVLLTGVHGFKGATLAALLLELGVKKLVTAGLESDNNGLYRALELEARGVAVHSLDVRDHEGVTALFQASQPDVVFHLAAQPIVSIGYADPYTTFSSNVMGTVNVLDGVRGLARKVSAVMVTTDKVYKDQAKEAGYVEEDLLLGHDPYSASKSAAEHAIYSFNRSYFEATHGSAQAKLVSPCRAGNVIGGGDFSADRLIPDMARAMREAGSVYIRNFTAVRPYEHVLDAVFAYVILAAKQWEDESLVGAYNVGPNDESIMSNREVVEYFASRSAMQVVDEANGKVFHETQLLKLDSSKFRSTFSWEPYWASKEAILEHTFNWYKQWTEGATMSEVTFQQIKEFLGE